MKVKGKLPFLNIVLIMMIGLVACGQSNEETIEAADVEVDDITTYEQVTIELENRTVEFTEMPQRVVTLEQSATEMMLALGLEQYMVGTAFLSSEILPEYKDEYSNIPVIADKYPSKESFLEANPDFALAGINIFHEDRIGTVENLEELGIKAYSLQATNLTDATLEDVYEDIRNIGRIFKVEDRADELIATLEEAMAEVSDKIASKVNIESEPVRVFAYQSGEDTPFAVTQGIVNNLIEEVGGTNILNHINEGPHANVSWEAVVEGDPEVIIIFEPYNGPNGEGDFEEKKNFLLTHPALADVDAIKNERFGVIPTVDKFEGIRVARLFEGLAKSIYPEVFE